MANFNLSIVDGQLIYLDAAKSLVTHDGKLYTNANQIATAEDWTAAHWTETTVAAWTASL